MRCEGIYVVFRSAKARTFAERKTTFFYNSQVGRGAPNATPGCGTHFHGFIADHLLAAEWWYPLLNVADSFWYCPVRTSTKSKVSR
jgi:hypothetical protein